MRIVKIQDNPCPAYEVQGMSGLDINEVVGFVQNPPHDEYIFNFMNSSFIFRTKQESMQFGMGMTTMLECLIVQGVLK